MQGLIAAAPRSLDDLDEESRSSTSRRAAPGADAPGVAFTINPRLVRGLDYYNLTVFEWVTDALGRPGHVCAGGRYDGLIEQIGGKPAPAAGFAMGVERLIALMAGAATPEPWLDVYVVWSGAQAEAHAWRVAERLRDGGLNVFMHHGGGSFKSQMKRADGSGARFAVIVGDDEAQADEATLKPLREQREQARVRVTDLMALIKG
jgi:histidyl-tRNA synthetase